MVIADDSTTVGTRLEYKYPMNLSMLRRCEALIERTCRALSFGGSSLSTVHTMYFDDETLRCCRKAMSGARPRSKLRLRWYGGAESGVFIELKEQIGRFTVKRRRRIDLRPSPDTRPGDIARELDEALVLPGDDRFRAALALYPHPVVSVCYERRYFEAPESIYRITIDRNIAFRILRPAERPMSHRRTGIVERPVLEIKIPADRQPGHAASLAGDLGLRRGKFSKYACSCIAGGLFHHPPRG